MLLQAKRQATGAPDLICSRQVWGTLTYIQPQLQLPRESGQTEPQILLDRHCGLRGRCHISFAQRARVIDRYDRGPEA